MNDSLMSDDRKKSDKDKPSPLRDIGIGGIKASDALSRSEASALQSLGSDEPPADDVSALAGVRDADSSGFDSGDRRAVDGSTGRVIQRSPQYAEVFTIKKGNRKYLTGERDRLDSDLAGYVIALIIFIGFAAALVVFSLDTAPGKKGPPLAILLPILGGVALITFVLMVRSYRISKDFQDNGQLLLGKLITASGRWVTTSTGKSTSRNYIITVAYQVKLPNGQTLDGTQKQTRNDLARVGAPEAGTPVAVLVMPDTKKMRLL